MGKIRHNTISEAAAWHIKPGGCFRFTRSDSMAHPFDNIPQLLKEQANWVVWGIQGAPPKAPFNPASLLTGSKTPAKAGIKDTWGNYDTAIMCVKRGLARGIGYEFEGDDLYGIDLDNVIDKHGALIPEAYDIVSSLDSYTELSPSGAGLHIFVFAPEAEITRHRNKNHFLEIYNQGRYFTVTGNVYGGIKQIETRSQELNSIHDKFLLPPATEKRTFYTTISTVTGIPQDKFLKIGLERDKVFAALWGGQRRHGNESADDIALMNKLAYWCNGDNDAMIQAFTSSPYYAQKDDAHIKKCGRSDYLPITASKASSTAYSTAAADYERYQQRKTMERSYAR
jgi:putative DNA primase/helicase